MSTQTVTHEQYELQTPKLTPSTSRTFESAITTPADSTTRLQRSDRVGSDSLSKVDDQEADKVPSTQDEPTEGAVEVAPEGGYGWVIVAICSLAK